MNRMDKIVWICFTILFMSGLFTGCSVSSNQKVKVPDWSVNATMYEVNIRQYTGEGTFQAFEEHLPRLQAMGVKILWLMPIYPISQERRLGTLGSYYSITDYQEINPEFGDKEDFKHLVEQCHEMGFQVILDWVGNHTGWDHEWIRKHPDWYTRASDGKIIYPEDWEDVADLNYDSRAMQNAMLKAMAYWVKEFDVDGYRCDYASGVPLEFWNKARKKLERIKPVYMLAEDDKARSFLTYAFNSNYGWSLYHDLNNIARGVKKASSLTDYFKNTVSAYPQGSYPLHFIDNHDENSWNGTVQERLGDSQQAMLALIFTAPGMPLIYSGQEVNLNHRLEFFDKDEISWNNPVNEKLLTALIHLKLEHPALWNGEEGGEIRFITSSREKVLVYRRQRDEDQILVILNLSKDTANVTIALDKEFQGRDFISGEEVKLPQGKNQLSMQPWEYRIYTK